MDKVTITTEIDLKKEGLFLMKDMKEVFLLLNEVYGRLWCEAYYDPYNEITRKFAEPLSDKLSQVNKLLGFKK